MSDLDPEIYEAVFYSIENPALVIDYDFVIRDANPAAATFLRYPDDDALIGTHVANILVNERILEDVTEQILSDEQWVGECELLTHDNRVFYGMGSAVPVEVAGQNVLAGVFTDLTERRRHTRALRILNRVLRHNIRNDINVVLGHVEQVGALVDDEAAQHSVEMVRNRLSDIIDRADTARDLEHLLNTQEQAVVNTLRLGETLRPVVERADREFPDAEFDIAEATEPVHVVANNTVTRVFWEVLENAVEHNTSAEPRVHLSLTVNDDTAVVSVADNGPGVFESRREMIFGREELDQVHHGNGFSLFFVDQVMNTYGGDVWVEANDSGGATFKLQFTRAW